MKKIIWVVFLLALLSSATYAAAETDVITFQAKGDIAFTGQNNGLMGDSSDLQYCGYKHFTLDKSKTEETPSNNFTKLTLGVKGTYKNASRPCKIGSASLYFTTAQKIYYVNTRTGEYNKCTFDLGLGYHYIPLKAHHVRNVQIGNVKCPIDSKGNKANIELRTTNDGSRVVTLIETKPKPVKLTCKNLHTGLYWVSARYLTVFMAPPATYVPDGCIDFHGEPVIFFMYNRTKDNMGTLTITNLDSAVWTDQIHSGLTMKKDVFWLAKGAVNLQSYNGQSGTATINKSPYWLSNGIFIRTGKLLRYTCKIVNKQGETVPNGDNVCQFEPGSNDVKFDFEIGSQTNLYLVVTAMLGDRQISSAPGVSLKVTN